MIIKVCRSKCCNAEVKTDGLPDFIGSKKVCTVSFTCLKCGKPCDTNEKKSLEINIDDDIALRLTKEGRRVYKEYYSRCRGVIGGYRLQYGINGRAPKLKKDCDGWIRFQLFDFMHIFGDAIAAIHLPQIIVDNIIRIPNPD